MFCSSKFFTPFNITALIENGDLYNYVSQSLMGLSDSWSLFSDSMSCWLWRLDSLTDFNPSAPCFPCSATAHHLEAATRVVLQTAFWICIKSIFFLPCCWSWWWEKESKQNPEKLCKAHADSPGLDCCRLQGRQVWGSVLWGNSPALLHIAGTVLTIRKEVWLPVS